jgi:hypothetical protein
MSTTPPVAVEVLDPWDVVPVGRTIPLRVSLLRPIDRTGSVRIPLLGHPKTERAVLNLDLFPRDICLRPGESYTVTVGVQFREPGPANLNEFDVQVKPDGDQPTPELWEGVLVQLPARSFRVVPDLEREIHIEVVRVCGYESGVKVAIAAENRGATVWRNLELSVGPRTCLRSGPTCRREPEFPPGQRLTFEVIIAGDIVEVELWAMFGDDRVSARTVCPIPVADLELRRPPFVFLEPRNLTHDRVIIKAEADGTELTPAGGVYSVEGDKGRYIVTVFPSRPGVVSVELLRAPGMIEVEEMDSDGGAWSFLITVVENPLFSTTARLYYDITLPNQTLRGELYFAIRPTTMRWWLFALTAGVAITAKGAAALAPAILHPADTLHEFMEDWGSLLSKRWTDLAALVSIPIIRGLVSLADQFNRPFESD